MIAIKDWPKDSRYPGYLFCKEVVTEDYENKSVRALLTIREPDQEEIREGKKEWIAEFSAESPLILEKIIKLFGRNGILGVADLGGPSRSSGIFESDIHKIYGFYRIKKRQP